MILANKGAFTVTRQSQPTKSLRPSAANKKPGATLISETGQGQCVSECVRSVITTGCLALLLKRDNETPFTSDSPTLRGY